MYVDTHNPLVMTKIAIVSFPMKHGDLPVRYLNVYQRVTVNDKYNYHYDIESLNYKTYTP